MDAIRSPQRKNVSPNLAAAVLSCFLSCVTSVTAVFVAFDGRSIALFAASDGLELGIGLGLATGLVVGLGAAGAPKKFALRVAIAGGIALPLLVAGLWYCAWAASMRSI